MLQLFAGGGDRSIMGFVAGFDWSSSFLSFLSERRCVVLGFIYIYIYICKVVLFLNYF